MTAPIIENNYTGDGSTVLFSFTFEYIEATDIEVSIDNVTIATTEYSLANSTTIEFNTAPATGTAVRIYRNTTVNEPKATFFPGSAIRAQDLNDNFEQILFVTQEADAISERAETAADAAQTATTTAQAAAASANTAGAAAQASASAAQASATSAQASATAAAADASQASTDAASAVATANTASTNASNAVTTANAASALISTAVLADGTRAMSGDLNVNSNKVVNLANPTAGGDAVNKSFADANYQPLDAELTELATMQNTTASALADLTQAEVLVLDGATLSTAELNTLDGITATTSELNTLDGITSTVGELNVLDGVTATTTELNITDGLTASTAELNQLDGKTISNVLTPANNNDIPTSSAVNTYVSGLLNALGGFVAIANESSFPTTNPDPSDNAGTVVSIADAGGLVVDSSGTSTSGTTTGNATVTITGFPSSLHSTTLGNDLGLQVQTTSTLNTYTYHKLIAKESDVVRLSDDINDFNERYRVSATAPTTDLDAGDLWFDTTAGKMKVYDANDSAWEEVQSVGNFFINTLSSSSGIGGGSATFNGSAYRFTLSNAGANAQQMLVSINGVIQKPNSGNTVPFEGFAIDTNDIIFSAAPPTNAPFFIVTIGSSVNIGAPSNNTVDTSQLVDGAVTNAKVSSTAAIAGTKISPDFGSQNVVTTGRLLLGTTTEGGVDADNLTIADSGNCGLTIRSGSGNGGSIYFSDATSGAGEYDGFIAYNQSSQFMQIGTAQAERLRIDSAGNVAIGKTSANALLDVNGQARFGGNKVTLDTDGSISGTISNSTTRAFVLSNTNVNADYFGGRVIQIGPDGTVNIGGSAGTSPSSYSSPNIKLNPAGSSYINGGSLGIYTTSPTTPLSVRSASSITTYGNVSAQFSDNSTGSLYVQHSSGKVQLGSDTALAFGSGSSATEAVRITTVGRVGIGEVTPAHKLHVKDGSSSTVAQFESTNGNHVYLRFKHNGSANGYIGYEETDVTIWAATAANNTSQRVARFDSDGLKFGNDTAADNALDDYERGTWTPSGVDNFNGITSAEGQYEKIGNLVNVVFQFNYSSLDSSTSSSGISGLPFTVYDFNSLTGVEATNVCFGTNKHVLVYANSGSTNLYFDTAKPLYGSTSTGADFFRANLTYLAG